MGRLLARERGYMSMRNSHGLAFFIFTVLLLIASIASSQDKDAAGCRDHPLITRIPNFYIEDCQEQEFGQYKFRNKDGGEISVEGNSYKIDYYVKQNTKAPSELQIVRNFNNAVNRIGGVLIHEEPGNIYLKVEKGGAVTWLHVRAFNQGESYTLNIIEKKSMVQKVLADASSMIRDISTSGKVSIYGIYFDFNKADVKPESEPALKEISRLLSQNPQMKLYIVGHTDNVGGLDYNMKLSQARADAVVKDLVSKYKVAPDRLKANGIGPLAPVTSNDSEDGKAKNRRVELVKQ
jgi:OmpA-OmpF porin, OOP family